MGRDEERIALKVDSSLLTIANLQYLSELLQNPLCGLKGALVD